MRLFYNLHRTLQYKCKATVNRGLFARGFLIMAESLVSSTSDSYLSPTESGELRINIEFRKKLGANVCLMCIGVFNRTLSISPDNVVSVQDYTG